MEVVDTVLGQETQATSCRSGSRAYIHKHWLDESGFAIFSTCSDKNVSGALGKSPGTVARATRHNNLIPGSQETVLIWEKRCGLAA